MNDTWRLMIPGPIELAEETRAELAKPMVPHYGAEWTQFHNETIDLLRRVFLTDGRVFAIPGSGSAGLDAAIGSSLGKGDRLLVLTNGLFGDRIAEIARSYDAGTAVHEVPPDRPIVVRELEAAMAKHGDVTSVAMVHSESSSGLLNPVAELTAWCKSRGLLTIVDAISSLGGVPLRMDEWGVDLCISASQKCLEGPPGLALVAVGRNAWSRIQENASPGWYLNLRVWHAYAEKWADWHPFPVTMAVPAFRALRKGVDRVLQEGLDRRVSRHRRVAAFVRQELEKLGFHPLFPEEIASPTVIAAKGRRDLSAAVLADRLRAEHGILVAGGMGEFKGKVFRIGNMGPQATEERMGQLIKAVASMAPEGHETE
jgi:alanine-glyoxylate transaminase/serine-glyoxylate transaminase/serine-pyruvate transaminase